MTVHLAGDDFTAEVHGEGWPMVGMAATVRRGRYEWPGRIESFAPGEKFTLAWTLKSGDPRSVSGYCKAGLHRVGQHVELHGRGRPRAAQSGHRR